MHELLFFRIQHSKNKLSFIDTEWKMKDKKQGPGPGAYARFSDFSGIERVEV